MNPLQLAIKAGVETLQSLEGFEQSIQTAADWMVESLTTGNKLLICGNGGSASDSMHIATEFMCRFKGDRRPYPAIALNADGGLLTAIGNDYAFQDIFSRQIAALGKPGDILITLTTSGKSRNILTAIEEARRVGMRTISFLGKGGGFITGAGELEFLIDSTETARIQEAQKFLLHVLCDIVDSRLPVK
ncbi:MAG: SIS domain-containing protein [Chthoniobacterales bacterium]